SSYRACSSRGLCVSVVKALRGLLLRHAMHSAKTPYEISRVDGDDFALRKKLRQGVQRDTVVGTIENRRENDSVSNVEISVACGKSAAFEDNRLRHGDLYNIERPAVLIASGLQAAEVG